MGRTDPPGRAAGHFRVRERRLQTPAETHPESLLRKLQIKPDTPFYDWLEQELARRFDYACCASLEQFRREDKAVTRAGGEVRPGAPREG